MILILESYNSQFVCTHRCSYGATSFEKEQFIALADVLLSANNKRVLWIS